MTSYVFKGLGFLAAGCKGLENICISGTDCTDDGIAVLLVECAALEPDDIGSRDSTDLDGLGEIKGDQTLITLGATRPNLASFCLQCSEAVTGVGLAALAAGCKGIEHLTIQDCPQLTDADFATAVHDFPLVPFEQLKLGYSDDWEEDTVLGDNFIIALVSAHGASIASLDNSNMHLKQCWYNLSDLGFSHILRECTAALSTDFGPFADIYREFEEYDGDDVDIPLGDLSCSVIADRFQGINELNLKGCRGVTDAGLLSIANKCRAITSVNLSFTQVTAEGIAALAQSHGGMITSLTIVDGNERNLTDADFAAIVLGFPAVPFGQLHLETASDSSYNETRGDEYVAAIASVHGPTIQGLPALESLLPLNLTDVGMSHIIDECTSALTTFKDVLSLLELHVASTGANLRKLLGDKCASAIADRFPDLKDLDYSNYTLSDDGLSMIANACKELTSVALTCQQLTVAALQNLGQECAQIASLTLYNCSAFTDADWAKLVRSFPRVNTIDSTAYVDRRGDKFVAALVSTHGTRCTTITFTSWYLDNFLHNITEMGLSQLVREFTSMNSTFQQIRSLVQKHQKVTKRQKGTESCMGDLLASAIISRFRDADRLELDFCTKLTDATLILEASRCRSVTSVDLAGCSSITCAGLVALGTSCKHITSLKIADKVRASFNAADCVAIVKSFPSVAISGLGLLLGNDVHSRLKLGDEYLEAVVSVHGPSIMSLAELRYDEYVSSDPQTAHSTLTTFLIILWQLIAVRVHVHANEAGRGGGREAGMGGGLGGCLP